MKIPDQLIKDFPGNAISFQSSYREDGSYIGYYLKVNDRKILLHITSGFLNSQEIETEKGRTLYWMFVKYLIDIFGCQPEEGSFADSLRFTVDEEEFFEYLRNKVKIEPRYDSRERYDNKALPEYEGDEEEIYRKIMEQYRGRFDDLNEYIEKLKE